MITVTLFALAIVNVLTKKVAIFSVAPAASHSFLHFS
jgi:hypothetical protein